MCYSVIMQIFEFRCRSKEEEVGNATNCAIFPLEAGHKRWADLHTLSHYDKAKKTIYFRRNGKLALPTPIPLKKVEGMNAIHITYLFMY